MIYDQFCVEERSISCWKTSCGHPKLPFCTALHRRPGTPLLGLSNADLDCLSKHVDMIIDIGAPLASSLQTYQSLRRSNCFTIELCSMALVRYNYAYPRPPHLSYLIKTQTTTHSVGLPTYSSLPRARQLKRLVSKPRTTAMARPHLLPSSSVEHSTFRCSYTI